MPYTPHNWIAGDSANASRLNNLESQFTEASQSRAPNDTSAYIESGLVATKDGTTATQLDVTSGTGWLLQADSTLRRRVTSASTPGQFLTATPSTTYHLYLQPDGTFYWSTSNSPAANSLAIANVTTDGSGNISTVTDARTLNATLLSTLSGLLTLPTLTSNVKVSGSGGQFYWGGALLGANKQMMQFLPTDTGDNWVFNYLTDFSLAYFDATTSKTPLRMFNTGAIQTDGGAIATNGSGAFTKIGNQATAGSFGAAPIVAQALNVAVAVTTLTTILTFAVPANGFYRLSGHFTTNNSASSESIRFLASYTDVNSGLVQTAWFVSSQDPSATSSAPALVAAGVGIGSNNNLPHAMNSFTINAKSGTNILIQYQDPAGVPSDTITVFIERLA